MNITLQGVTFSYRSTPTIQKVDLQLRDKEVLGLIGPNGSGKTTLLKCINKILEPKQGTILLDGQNMKKMSRQQVARQVGYVPQHSQDSTDGLPVYEVVLMGRKPHISWASTQKDDEKVWDALKALNIEHVANRNFFELSGGEQQRVLVARSIAQEAKVLLLDEPTSSLDIRHQLEVMELTRQLVAKQNLSAAIAIHDLNLAARFCDKIVMLKAGEIYATGDAKSVLVKENIGAVYGVDVELNFGGKVPFIIPISAIV